MTTLNTLLPVQKTGEINTINARDLHSALGVGRDFSTWIKSRLDKARLVENRDFLLIHQNGGTKGKGGDRRSIDYFLSLDAAKHIAMLENTDIGFEVRDYFIRCEKQLLADRSTKQSLFMDIIEASTELDTALAVKALNDVYIKPLEVKAEFHDDVLKSEHLYTITQIANDFPITNRKLNKLLEEAKIQYKDKSGIWTISAKYNHLRLAQTQTVVYNDKGVNRTTQNLKWTQEGRRFIYQFLKDQGIHPNNKGETHEALS